MVKKWSFVYKGYDIELLPDIKRKIAAEKTLKQQLNEMLVQILLDNARNLYSKYIERIEDEKKKYKIGVPTTKETKEYIKNHKYFPDDFVKIQEHGILEYIKLNM